MSHDPRLTIFYSFVWEAVQTGARIITFNREHAESGFRVRFDGELIVVPSVPSGLFNGIRFWAMELSGMDHSLAAMPPSIFAYA